MLSRDLLTSACWARTKGVLEGKGPGEGWRDAGGEEDEWGLAGAVCRLPLGSVPCPWGSTHASVLQPPQQDGGPARRLWPRRDRRGVLHASCN